MKTYPSIDAKIRDGKYYVFNKLDGSNIRAEYSKKKGFHKFGTRRRLLDPNEKPFGKAVPLIMRLEDQVSDILKKQRIDRATFFFEFYGEKSFAGYHDNDGHFKVDLLDVNVYRKGILGPKEFLKVFGDIPHAELLYYGNITEELLSQIRDGTLEGMSFEGVICKAKFKNNDYSSQMFKIKNQAWYEALRSKCKTDEEFQKLM